MKLSPALRKAAILISALDARSADALLDQMGEAQARRVRDAVMELGDVPAAEQERIIAEFMGREQRPVVAESDDGIELAGSLARLSTTPASAADTPAAPSPNAAPAPFSFLLGASCDAVARHLLREHPQTIALVLAHLPPHKAASLVKRFPHDIQAEVLERIGAIEEMDQDVVREVERGLEVVLAHELRQTRRRGAGMATLQAILKAAGEDREQLVQTVMHRDPRLGEQVAPEEALRAPALAAPRRRSSPVVSQPAFRPQTKPAQPVLAPAAPTIEFSQLAQLDDRSWGKLLRSAEMQVALLALAGATPELVARLLGQLPSAEARVLERKIEQLGPVRLRDIERAQEHLARIAAQLVARGEIRIPQPRPFATAA